MRKYASHLGRKLNSNQRGAILIWLIFILVAAGILGSSMVYLTTSSTYDELLANNQARAYYIAEAGGRYVIPRMAQGDTADFFDTDGNPLVVPFTLENGDIFEISEMDINPEPDNPMTVVSTGIVNVGSWLEGRRKITYSLNMTHPFQQAAYGSEVALDNNAMTDSYDSSVGCYGGSNVGSNGDVTTESSSISLANDSVINGDQNTNASSDFSPVSLPEGGEHLIPFDYQIIIDATLSNDTFRALQVKLDNEVQLTIEGEVELIVEQDFTISNNSSIDLLPGATLIIYVDGNILFDNVSNINSVDCVSENFIIYGTSNTDIVELKNDSTVYAVIYAPDSSIILDNSCVLFGALIGDQVLLKNDAKLHFDEALLTTTKVFDDEVPLIVGSIIQY